MKRSYSMLVNEAMVAADVQNNADCLCSCSSLYVEVPCDFVMDTGDRIVFECPHCGARYIRTKVDWKTLVPSNPPLYIPPKEEVLPDFYW